MLAKRSDLNFRTCSRSYYILSAIVATVDGQETKNINTHNTISHGEVGEVRQVPIDYFLL